MMPAKGSWVPIYWCLLTSMAVTGPVLGATDTSVFSPSSLSDNSGNSADADSKIVYGPFVENGNGTEIQCSKCVGDGGIRPFLNAAQGFAHMVIPDGVDYEMIEKVKDGDIDYQELVKGHMGLIICAGIGLIFFIVFPIVGMCVCCCRCCCNNCGGSRRTEGDPQKGPRSCFMVSLAVLSIFVGAGGALVLATNSSVSDGIDNFHNDVPSNLDSLVDYLKESVKEIEDIATSDFNFTRDVIFRDLDNIGYLLGGDVKRNVEKELNLDAITTTVTTIETALNKTLVVVPNINKQIQEVRDNVTAYTTAMTQVQNDFNTATSTSGAQGVNATIDTNQIPTLTGLNELEEVQKASFTKLLNDAMTEIHDIPNRVQTKSTTSVADMKKSINGYTKDVKDLTEDMDIDDKIDKQGIKDDVSEYTDKAIEYDKYRWYAGVGLGCIILLITVLFVLGLVFGCVGGNGSIPPHKRGPGSNCGGNLLLAACGFTFIFGSLLMIITTVMFVVGTPAEDYVCAALKDPSILDKLIDNYDLLGSTDGTGNYFGDKLLDDPNKNLTLSEVLSNCEKDQAIYKALRINESNLINLTDILDYKSKFSVKEHMSSISVDFSDVKLLSPDMKTNLEKLNNAINYNITQYDNELGRDATKPAVDFQNTLKSSLSTIPPAQKPIYTKTINDIQQILGNQGAQLKSSMTTLKTSISELDGILHPASKPSLSEEITSLESQLGALDGSIETAGNKSLQDGIKTFSDRLFGVTDSFIDYLLDALDNKVGKCRPVWNFYNSLLKDNLCGTVIDSVNGFWFGLGWSIFFLMPSLVIAMKLSSHFRRMKLDDSMSSFSPYNGEMKTLPDGQGPPPYIKPNKVKPMP